MRRTRHKLERWRLGRESVGALAASVCILLELGAGAAVPAAASNGARPFDVYLLSPVTSGAAGFGYRYDPVTGGFDREDGLTAQLFIERPVTIGEKQWSINASTSYIKPGTTTGLYGVGSVYVESFGVTYGIADNTEINLTVPLLIYRKHRGTTALLDPVILRGKYNVHVRGPIEVAVGLAVRTRTVHAAARDIEFIPQVHLATRRYSVTDEFRLQSYLDLGFNVTAVANADASWGLGLDAAIGDHFVLGLAFLGRNRIDANPSKTSLTGVALVDAAVTGRISLWADRLMLVAGALVPLDRTKQKDFDVIPTLGIEAGF